TLGALGTVTVGGTLSPSGTVTIRRAFAALGTVTVRRALCTVIVGRALGALGTVTIRRTFGTLWSLFAGRPVGATVGTGRTVAGAGCTIIRVPALLGRSFGIRFVPAVLGALAANLAAGSGRGSFGRFLASEFVDRHSAFRVISNCMAGHSTFG